MNECFRQWLLCVTYVMGLGLLNGWIQQARNAGDRIHFGPAWQYIRKPNPTTTTWDLIVP